MDSNGILLYMCSAPHVKRGAHVTDGEGVALNETIVIKNLEEGELYKFLGVLEGLKQEEQQFLQCAAKSNLQRRFLIITES